MIDNEQERLRRWRLILGKDAQETLCKGPGGSSQSGAECTLSKRDEGMDGAAREDDGRQGRVGTTVNREVDFAAENLAGLADGGAVTSARGMSFRGRRHVFQAVIDNFHGTA